MIRVIQIIILTDVTNWSVYKSLHGACITRARRSVFDCTWSGQAVRGERSRRTSIVSLPAVSTTKSKACISRCQGVTRVGHRAVFTRDIFIISHQKGHKSTFFYVLSLWEEWSFMPFVHEERNMIHKYKQFDI